MSGISGVVGGGTIGKLVLALRHRGPDGFGILCEDGGVKIGEYNNLNKRDRGLLGYNFLSVKGNKKLPIVKDGSALVFDGRIYNYKDLKSRNGVEAVLKVLRKKGFDGLAQLDGEYAFAFVPDLDRDEIWLGRDVLGVKPLWISMNGRPRFASEAKALPGDVWPVLPGERLVLNKRGIQERIRVKLEREKPTKKNHKELKRLIEKAIEKRVEGLKKVGLLFSGGVDSTLLYVLLSKRVEVKAYTAGFPDSQDVSFARRASEEMGIDLHIEELSLEKVEDMLPEVVGQLETTNVMKIGVAFPFYISARIAKEEGINVIFSGLGTEELFAGYERHLEAYKSGGWDGLHQAMWDGIESMWERDLYRDDLATMAHSVELRVPFLDLEVVKEAMRIHPSLKLGEMKKQVLRKIAREEGVPDFIASRPKKAAQYGSGVDKAIRKLAKRKGMKPQDYLEWVSRGKN